MKTAIKILSVVLTTFVIYLILCAGEYTFLVHIMKISMLQVLFASYNLIIVGMMSFLTSLSLHKS